MDRNQAAVPLLITSVLLRISILPFPQKLSQILIALLHFKRSDLGSLASPIRHPYRVAGVPDEVKGIPNALLRCSKGETGKDSCCQVGLLLRQNR